MSRGIHTKPNQGESVVWLTPPEIIKAVGPFDLDPCGHDGWVTASKLLCPPFDGLAEQWHGRVWLNPPYGTKNSMLFLKKMAAYGNGIALVASRTETNWFHRFIWNAADSILFLRGRLHYHNPDGSRATGNAGHGSALVAYGKINSSILQASGVAGRFVNLRGLN